MVASTLHCGFGIQQLWFCYGPVADLQRATAGLKSKQMSDVSSEASRACCVVWLHAFASLHCLMKEWKGKHN
jgi:hypothetical protein